MTSPNKIKVFCKKRIPTLLPPTSYLLPLALAILITGCSDKEKEKSLTEGGMKCGAGKCGSSMVDGSAVLVKKKLNILNQMNKKDPRRDCVLKSKSTKALYNCVRDPNTGRLTITPKEKNSTTFTNNISVEKKVPEKEKSSQMKCQAGKCSGGN